MAFPKTRTIIRIIKPRLFPLCIRLCISILYNCITVYAIIFHANIASDNTQVYIEINIDCNRKLTKSEFVEEVTVSLLCSFTFSNLKTC